MIKLQVSKTSEFLKLSILHLILQNKSLHQYYEVAQTLKPLSLG